MKGDQATLGSTIMVIGQSNNLLDDRHELRRNLAVGLACHWVASAAVRTLPSLHVLYDVCEDHGCADLLLSWVANRIESQGRQVVAERSRAELNRIAHSLGADVEIVDVHHANASDTRIAHFVPEPPQNWVDLFADEGERP